MSKFVLTLEQPFSPNVLTFRGQREFGQNAASCVVKNARGGVHLKR